MIQIPKNIRTSLPTKYENVIYGMKFFNYKKFLLMGDRRAGELNTIGTYLCINPYTGQLIPTETE